MAMGGSGSGERIEYKGSDSWGALDADLAESEKRSAEANELGAALVEYIKTLPVREKRVPLTSDNVHQWVKDLIEKGVDTELETCDESLIG